MPTAGKLDWPAPRACGGCRTLVRRATAAVRAGRRALAKHDCAGAEADRVSGMAMFRAAAQVCGPCDLERARGAMLDAVDLRAAVRACLMG